MTLTSTVMPDFRWPSQSRIALASTSSARADATTISSLRAEGARVVNVSSSAHLMGSVVFDDIHYDQCPYGSWQAYGRSKTANVNFAHTGEHCLSDGP